MISAVNGSVPIGAVRFTMPRAPATKQLNKWSKWVSIVEHTLDHFFLFLTCITTADSLSVNRRRRRHKLVYRIARRTRKHKKKKKRKTTLSTSFLFFFFFSLFLSLTRERERESEREKKQVSAVTWQWNDWQITERKSPGLIKARYQLLGPPYSLGRSSL